MNPRLRMAYDDILVLLLVVCLGLYGCYINWNESDWLGFVGTVIMVLIGGLFLAIRIYHVTHKKEVFGVDE